MYTNTSNNYNNTSFQYITPNSRIVPPPSSAEYHVNIESWRQPARSSSLQKTRPFDRESLIDPSGQGHTYHAQEAFIEPNTSALAIDSVTEGYYLNSNKSPHYPHSPVPNMNYYNDLQNDTSYHDPQIQTMNPPKFVKSNVQIQQSVVEAPQPSVAVYEEIPQNNSNFSLQPVPHKKKINPIHYDDTINQYNNNNSPVTTVSGCTSRSATTTTTNTRLPKPPLTPLVIPATPIRSSSSPNRTLLTPTRISSMQNSPLPTPGGLSTPGSSRSANSPSGLSPFTCSPSTPSPNTLHPHAMLPSPLGGAPQNNVENGIKKALSSKKLSMLPESEAERLVHQGIKFHEAGKLEQATDVFKQASQLELPIAMFLYGVSLRHGWGCNKNEHLAFQYLQKAAEHAVVDLNNFSTAMNTSAAKGELIMAIYELGVSFRHGWGCKKNKETAVYYFKIAADLNDPDAQNDLGHCYYHGHGVKKDLHLAAKYYRLADKQGQGIMGNSWIWKAKYDKASK